MKDADAKERVHTASDLYEYFKNKPNDDVAYKIEKDLSRTKKGEQRFKIDYRTGQNMLFHVLKAYAMFDPEISYCQGMNFIVALLLKYLNDEEDAFYCLIHVMHNKKWRNCFDMETSKLINLLEFLECVLETAWTDVYDHIMAEIGISLVPVFSSIIQTIFIYDSPDEIATHIFDVFLLDGETIIFTLLLKMIEIKE